MHNGIISAPKNKHSPSAFSCIATIVLLAGSADILIALLQYNWSTGKNPTTVLKFIASGIFGGRAFAGGDVMIWWGLVFHYCIVLLWVLFFYFSFPLLFSFVNNRWIFALLAALCIWIVMNLVVLPLSQTPSMPFRWQPALISMGILFIAVGIPLSFLLRRHYK